jgi:hypothetical protein
VECLCRALSHCTGTHLSDVHPFRSQLDYAQSLCSEDESRTAHRRLVTILRQHRPELSPGTETSQAMLGWDASSMDLRASRYVLKHVAHHIEHAIRPEDWESDLEMTGWIDDYTKMQDAIPLAVAEFLGVPRVVQFARQAEVAGNFWTASLRWSAAALATRVTEGQQSTHGLFKSCAAALEHVRPSTAQEQDAKDRLEFATLTLILNAWDPADVPMYSPRLERLQETAAAKEDRENLALSVIILEVYPEACVRQRCGAHTPEELLESVALLKAMRILVNNFLEKEVGSHARRRALSLAYCFHCEQFLDLVNDAPGFEWDQMFGQGGSYLTEASLAYDFDSFHHLVKNQHSWDGNVRPSHVFPLLLHYGDLASANANADRSLQHFKRMLAEPTPCGTTLCTGLVMWPQALYLLGREEDAAELLRAAGAVSTTPPHSQLTKKAPPQLTET